MAKNEELKEILRRTDRLLLKGYQTKKVEADVLMEDKLLEARPLGHPSGYPSEERIRASISQMKKRDAEKLLDRMKDQENEPTAFRSEMDEMHGDEMYGDEMHAEHWDCPECGCEDNTSIDCPHCGYKHSSGDDHGGYGSGEMQASDDFHRNEMDVNEDTMEEGAVYYEDLYSKFLAEETDKDDEDDDADDDSDDDSDDAKDEGKKSNGHKADCECPLCKNLKEATDEHNINSPAHHKTGTPLETDAGDNKANKNKANMKRDGGKRALNPTAKAKAVLAKGAVSESKLNEFVNNDEEDDTASTKMSQDEMSQLRWMLNLLGRNKEYAYARRVFEKARSGQAITVPQEKKVLHEMIELYMRADKGALRIFLNRLK